MCKTPFNDNYNNVFVVQSLLRFCWFGEVLQFYAKIFCEKCSLAEFEEEECVRLLKIE